LLSEPLIKNRFSNLPFEYTPWMVANITVSELPEYKGEPLSWDNVIYQSKSLGYVNACQQHLNKEESSKVLTYYLPLVDLPAKEARKQAREKTHEDWVKDIVLDLKMAHQDIENYITNIDIKIWGHAMIKPLPNFIFNPEKDIYCKPINNKLFLHIQIYQESPFSKKVFIKALMLQNKSLHYMIKLQQHNWIGNSKVESIGILSIPFLCLVLLFFVPSSFIQSDAMPEFMWLF